MTERTTSRRALLLWTGSTAATAVAGCLSVSSDGDEPEAYATPAADAFDDVVDAMWLEDNLESVELLDSRPESDFTDEHVAGAHRFPDTDMMRDHYTETDDGPEAALEHVGAVAEAAGIERDDDVVVYGEGSSLWETYGVYTLRAIGHEGDVALLDGGFPTWADAGGATETGTPETEPTSYEPDLDRSVLATREDIADTVDEDGTDVQLVDNRTPAEYRGVDDGDDRVDRHGHITGAINVEFTQNVVDGGRRLRSPADLERLWLEDAGLEPDAATISYCQTAVRASVGWFVMDQLGWADVTNYEGSWLDWGTLSADDGYQYTSGEGSGTVVDTFA